MNIDLPPDLANTPWHGDPIVLRGIATTYALRFGCEAFPVIEKAPAFNHAWKENALGRPGIQDAEDAAWLFATGYGLTPIRGSSLVIIDSDLAAFTRLILAAIPSLESSATIRRGDNCHIYVRLSCSLPKAYIDLTDDSDKHHIASLRGAGAYVVGPYSRHPSGDIYEPQSVNRVVQLTESETGELLAIFGVTGQQWPGDRQAGSPMPGNARDGRERLDRERPPMQAAKDCGADPDLVQRLLDHFQAQGYHATYDRRRGIWWLNGQCPNHANHKHDDRHLSFGFNTRGVGHCFVCGPMLTYEVAALVGIRWLRPISQTPVIEREQRADLIAAGQTRAARLVDMIQVLRQVKRKDRRGVNREIIEKKSRFTIRELLHAGRRVGWSRACTYRNVRQAVSAGFLGKVTPGVYECLKEIEGPIITRGAGKAYSDHPAEYRKEVLKNVERQVQPEQPSIYNFSAARIAFLAGISERTLYRYEAALHIRRFQVWNRTPLPTVEGPSGAPVPYAPMDHLEGTRPSRYRRFEVVGSDHQAIRRIEYGPNPAAALSRALSIGAEWQGVVLLSERRPSIRVLPDQNFLDRIPAGARLSDDMRRIFIDPPFFGDLLGKNSPSRAHPQKKDRESAALTARKIERRRAALSNDSYPSVKNETTGESIDGERRIRESSGVSARLNHRQRGSRKFSSS